MTVTLTGHSGKINDNRARGKLAKHLNAMKAVVNSMQGGKENMRRVADGKTVSDDIAECGRYSAWC